MYEDIHVQISSILLGSVEIIWDQTTQHALSLWGPCGEDMCSDDGSRPKRILFLIATIFPLVMFIAYGYIYGAVALTIASVEGDELPEPSEKPALETEDATSEKDDPATEEVAADIEAADPKSTGSAPTASSNETSFPMSAGRAPQARLSIRRIMKERNFPPAWRHGLVYLLLNLLLSRILHYLTGLYLISSNTALQQWTVHLLTSTLLSPFRMLWTHALVTDANYPSPYLPSLTSPDLLKSYRTLLLPSLAYAVAQPGVVLCTAGVGKFFYNLAAAGGDNSWMLCIAYATAMVVGGVALMVVLVAVVATPAFVVLDRVEVALLREGVPTSVALYTHDEAAASDSIGSDGDGLREGFIAPSLRAWKSISTQTMRNMAWLCCAVTLWVAVPGSQFLQIGFAAAPGA